MVRTEDEKELAKRFDQVHVDTKSASAMFEVLRKKLNHTAAFPHFMSLLQHCLLLPRKEMISLSPPQKILTQTLLTVDYGAQPQHWLFFDRVVQQVVLQSSETQEDHDVAVIDVNVKEIIQE
jgi:dishevelled associated activator of morphogenesis